MIIDRRLGLFSCLFLLFALVSGTAMAYPTLALSWSKSALPSGLTCDSGLVFPDAELQVVVRFYAKDGTTPACVSDAIYDKLVTEAFEQYLTPVTKKLKEKVTACDAEITKPWPAKDADRVKAQKKAEDAVKTLNDSYLTTFLETAPNQIADNVSACWKKNMDAPSKTAGVQVVTEVRIDGVLIPSKTGFAIVRLFKKNPDRVKGLADAPRFTFQKGSLTTDGESLTVNSKYKFVSYESEYFRPNEYLEFSYQLPITIDDVSYNRILCDIIPPILKEKKDAFEKFLAAEDQKLDELDEAAIESTLEKNRAAVQTRYDAVAKELGDALQKGINAEIDQWKAVRKGAWKNRAIIVFKSGCTVVKAAFKISKLVGSSGADVTAWVGLANDIFEMAKTLKEAFDGIEATQKRVVETMNKVKGVLNGKIDVKTVLYVATSVNPLWKAVGDVESALTEYQDKIWRVYNKLSKNLQALQDLLDAQEASSNAKDPKVTKLIAQTETFVNTCSGLFATLSRHETYMHEVENCIRDARSQAAMADDGMIISFFKTRIGAVNVVEVAASAAGIGDYVTAAQNLVTVVKEVVSK